MSVDSLHGWREFRDTRAWFQYAMGGIAGLGIVGVYYLFKQSGQGGPAYLTAAGAAIVATLVVLAVVYFVFGKPVLLRPTAEGVQRICGDREQSVSFDQLTAFRAKWTDIHRNGVYQYTEVRFALSSGNRSAPDILYDATASYQTVKFEQLQAFQADMAAVVAERLADELERNGRVEWTEKLALRRDGIELTRKAGGAPEVVGFERVSQWKVDEGVFKLGIDDGRRPALVEEASQWNFYPGLLLFSRLCDSPGSQSVVGDEAHVVVG